MGQSDVRAWPQTCMIGGETFWTQHKERICPKCSSKIADDSKRWRHEPSVLSRGHEPPECAGWREKLAEAESLVRRLRDALSAATRELSSRVIDDSDQALIDTWISPLAEADAYLSGANVRPNEEGTHG